MAKEMLLTRNNFKMEIKVVKEDRHVLCALHSAFPDVNILHNYDTSAKTLTRGDTVN